MRIGRDTGDRKVLIRNRISAAAPSQKAFPPIQENPRNICLDTKLFSIVECRDQLYRVALAIALNHDGSPPFSDEVAKAVVFPAADAASYVTGATFNVNGDLITPWRNPVNAKQLRRQGGMVAKESSRWVEEVLWTEVLLTGGLLTIDAHSSEVSRHGSTFLLTAGALL